MPRKGRRGGATYRRQALPRSMTFLAGVSDLPSKNIAIAGLGEIGKTVARKLAQGLPGLALAAITTRDRAKAQAWLDREGIACPLVSLDELPDHADPLSNVRRLISSIRYAGRCCAPASRSWSSAPVRCCPVPIWSISRERMAVRSSCQPAP